MWLIQSAADWLMPGLSHALLNVPGAMPQLLDERLIVWLARARLAIAGNLPFCVADRASFFLQKKEART
ncbi:hypothetical protein [Pararhizobium polonicum]|uniref:hypothetical protein n=1 Tax=Pararhizobium polonicum TaxID=1612624 RepID=UPI00083A3B64|nr:hypothetical protein [Pararhizobium polonicum]